MRLLSTLAGGIILALALVACGTAPPANGDPDPDNGDPDGEATQYGYVAMDESGTDTANREVFGSGFFFESDMAIPAVYLTNPYYDEMGTCEVFTFGDFPEDPDFLPELPEDIVFTTLGAGDALTVHAAGQVDAYLTMDRDEITVGAETFVFYGHEDAVAGGLPEDLTASAPGDEFPAFSDEAFPEQPSFELTAPTDLAAAEITTATEFTWTPSGEANAVVTIDVMSNDFTTIVSCVAPDDGSFQFPAETVTELGAGFEGSLTSAGRSVFRLAAVGDANLVLSTTSTQEFLFAFGAD